MAQEKLPRFQEKQDAKERTTWKDAPEEDNL